MWELWEEAEKISVLGVDTYAFGLFCALGALGALVALYKLAPKGTAPLTGVLCLILGFLCSRGLYCLLDRSLGEAIPLRGWLMATGGGYSMAGALIGAGLGACLAGKIMKQPVLRMLDAVAVCALLFVFFERIGEQFVPDFGVSRTLNGEWTESNFFIVSDGYSGCIRTYRLEAMAALILFGVLLYDLRKNGRPGDTALLFALLFGATQVIFESLRYDRHISISFVGLQHVLAMALLGAGVIILAVRRMKTQKTLAILALSSVPVAVGVGVGLEFMIDRTTVSNLVIYAIMIAVVAAPAVLGMLLRKENAHG